MKAALLIIGDELLSGDTLDTNSQFASRILNNNGIQVACRLTVGDREREIHDGLTLLLKNADLVISSGGLGPTKDDVTKKAFANYFNSEMVWSKEVENSLKERYEKAGRALNPLTLEQASVPQKAETIINPVGTAPVFWFDEGGKVVVTLPGVPYEMRYLMENIVIQRVIARFKTDTIYHETIHTVGITESAIAGKLKALEDEIEKACNEKCYYKLAYLPDLGQVKLRLTGIGDNEKEIKELITKWKGVIETTLKDYIFGYNGDQLTVAIGDLLRKKHAILSTAESCTGGYVAHLITSVTGSSDYYTGGVVSYSNEVKIAELGVKEETLEKYGAVSEETCKEMVAGAMKRLKTDYAIATTGIAGPTGDTEGKPVGTVWIGVGNKDKIIATRYSFNRNRTENIHLFAITALDMLRKLLKDIEMPAGQI